MHRMQLFYFDRILGFGGNGGLGGWGDGMDPFGFPKIIISACSDFPKHICYNFLLNRTVR
jgi:hypothetical protein